MSEHVELIQPEDWANPSAFSGSAAPLFLIHDGGGTTFMYAFLPPLGRFVYGIRNPHFSTGEIFAGGVPEMSRLYAGWIRDTVARGDFPARKAADAGSGTVDIILGGWSFGGLVALEVAKLLGQDGTGIHVSGLLMVDTIFPSEQATAKPTPPPSTGEKSKNQVLSERAMEDARGMVRNWTLPVWEPASQRPRAVLLRAIDYIPWTNSPLDIERGQPENKLGWDKYDGDMFDDVIELEGHHFEVFMDSRLEKTAAGMRQGLDKLEHK